MNLLNEKMSQDKISKSKKQKCFDMRHVRLDYKATSKIASGRKNIFNYFRYKSLKICLVFFDKNMSFFQKKWVIFEIEGLKVLKNKSWRFREIIL